MSPLGERTRPEAYTESETVPVRVVLENIRSGLNVGAFFRTADAFRISGIDLCGYTAHPPQRDILKSALGADEHVPWSAHSDALSAIVKLREQGYKIASIEQTTNSISILNWEPKVGEKWALVFGNEVKGVEPDTCDASEIVVEIPQFGVKQSLNVSVCAGIVLWHAAQRIGLPG
ncbi:TrmH family RNA methyltransferase [bacterium]|nr:TrmH family RNA methyltransferase [bacterium]|tara:strand:- start:1194 stop:1718 length:525 start_codon:yes stop_codon:yes gene_type:complete